MSSKLPMGLPCLKLAILRHPRRVFSSFSRSLLRKGQKNGKNNESSGQLPTRDQQLKSLKTEIFDVLVIGGGAVGCGCALESSTRGLKTALIEADDFANGASCKSSKLIEGSSSYLHAAIQGADLQQIYMLQQVINERATMLGIAPHLNRVQPMLMPIYSPLRLPLYWLGLKLYDAMAGMANVRGSHFLSKEATLNEFPLLRREGLLGALVYYDGQLDDARMCLALALTAAKHDATVANYVQLLSLGKPQNESSCRKVRVLNVLTSEAFNIRSRCVINATGASTDVVRKLDDCNVRAIAVPRLGTHIALPSYYGSSHCGLLFPSKQTDEQALIMLPFENRLLVGSMQVEMPQSRSKPLAPNPQEIKCLLEQTRGVLEPCVQLRPDHVLSAWTGVKPSIICPYSLNNEDEDGGEVVPNFLVEVSGNQMITLAGGRWSTYRVMASDAIDTAIEHCQLEPHSSTSCTQQLLLDGAEDYYCMLPLDLVQTFNLPMDVAQHLAESYGSNAYQLLAKSTQCDRRRLHPKFPYIEKEVVYACQREYACQLVDVVARRLRVAFVDVVAAYEMLPTVLSIMSEHRCWKPEEQSRQLSIAQLFLANQMGLGSIVQQTELPCCKDKERRTSWNEMAENHNGQQFISPSVRAIQNGGSDTYSAGSPVEIHHQAVAAGHYSKATGTMSHTVIATPLNKEADSKKPQAQKPCGYIAYQMVGRSLSAIFNGADSSKTDQKNNGPSTKKIDQAGTACSVPYLKSRFTSIASATGSASVSDGSVPICLHERNSTPLSDKTIDTPAKNTSDASTLKPHTKADIGPRTSILMLPGTVRAGTVTSQQGIATSQTNAATGSNTADLTTKTPNSLTAITPSEATIPIGQPVKDLNSKDETVSSKHLGSGSKSLTVFKDTKPAQESANQNSKVSSSYPLPTVASIYRTSAARNVSMELIPNQETKASLDKRLTIPLKREANPITAIQISRSEPSAMLVASDEVKAATSQGIVVRAPPKRSKSMKPQEQHSFTNISTTHSNVSTESAAPLKRATSLRKPILLGRAGNNSNGQSYTNGSQTKT